MKDMAIIGMFSGVCKKCCDDPQAEKRYFLRMEKFDKEVVEKHDKLVGQGKLGKETYQQLIDALNGGNSL